MLKITLPEFLEKMPLPLVVLTRAGEVHFANAHFLEFSNLSHGANTLVAVREFLGAANVEKIKNQMVDFESKKIVIQIEDKDFYTDCFCFAENLIAVLFDRSECVEDRLIDEYETAFLFEESQRAANIGSYKADFKKGNFTSTDVMDKIFGINDKYEKSIDPGWTGLIHPEDKFMMLKYLQEEVLAKGLPFNKEYRIIRPNDGEVRWLNGLGKLILDEEKNPHYLIGTIQDVTARKFAELELRENQKKLDIAFKIAKLGAWELDLKQGYFSFNDTFYSLFKTTAKEVGGYTLTPNEYAEKFLPPEERARVGDEVAKAMQTQDPEYTQQLEHQFHYGNGEMGVLLVRFAIQKNAKGETVKLFGINQDVTEKRNVERELRRSEERLRKLNETKDKLFSIIAHDLRSPFGSIISLTELLEESVIKDEATNVIAYSGFIRRSAQRAQDLLGNLMLWSRCETERVKFEPIELNLRQVVQEGIHFLNPIAIDKKLKIENLVDAQMQLVADSDMLQLIIRNLVSNALKFSFANQKVWVQAIEENSGIKISIKDEGRGIPPDLVQKLFKIEEKVSRKGTNKEEGTGLGLILCKEFVEKHGGSIQVNSRENEGAEFIVFFPKRLNSP